MSSATALTAMVKKHDKVIAPYASLSQTPDGWMVSA